MADHPAACVLLDPVPQVATHAAVPDRLPLGIRGLILATPLRSLTRWTWAFWRQRHDQGCRTKASSLAGMLWMDLVRVGIDEEEVGKQLETEGVDEFAASYLKVLDIIRPECRGRQMTRPDGNCDKAG